MSWWACGGEGGFGHGVDDLLLPWKMVAGKGCLRCSSVYFFVYILRPIFLLISRFIVYVIVAGTPFAFRNKIMKKRILKK